MLFVSPSFLFLFLPASLAVYAILPPKSRRYGLLAINLLFYFFLCWHEPISFVLVLVTAAFTYSAGFLIERSCKRGMRIGDAMISYKHANFIVNVGNATYQDVTTLIRQIRTDVYRDTGIFLIPDIFQGLLTISVISK